MKTVFIGAVKFSEAMLKVVCRSKLEVTAIITTTQKNINSDYVDLTPLADLNHIPIYYIDDINNKISLDLIKSLAPDIILCFGWSRILKPEILKIPPLGALGYHPSLLPKNRGRHPIIWSLVLGLEETGSTFFLMNQEVDAGNIVSQVTVPINQLDNAETLYAKIINVAIGQLSSILLNLNLAIAEQTAPISYSSNIWRKRTEADGRIDWRMSCKAILNLIRGLYHPYPGAYFQYSNQKITVWEAEEVHHLSDNIEPGKILSSSLNEIIIKTGDCAIKITNFDPKVEILTGEYL